MRIVDVDDLELRSLGHLQPDTNDAFAEEHAERAAPPAERRHVGALTIGTVVGPEDRIEPPRQLEPIAKLFGRNRPGLGGTMARETGAAVGAEILEEGVVQVDRFARRDGALNA